MKPTGAQLREMRRENMRWPERLAAVPREQWPAASEANAGARPRIAFWRSRKFLVQAFDEGAGCIRLSVNRTEWDERAKRFRDDIDWDDLQRLKGEAGYGAHCALEVLPPEGFVVNVANMRHIFILPIGEAPAFMWGYERFQGCAVAA